MTFLFGRNGSVVFEKWLSWSAEMTFLFAISCMTRYPMYYLTFPFVMSCWQGYQMCFLTFPLAMSCLTRLFNVLSDLSVCDELSDEDIHYPVYFLTFWYAISCLTRISVYCTSDLSICDELPDQDIHVLYFLTFPFAMSCLTRLCCSRIWFFSRQFTPPLPAWNSNSVK